MDQRSPYDELNSPEVKEKYFNGIVNQFIRIYFYLKKGLELLNDFKYLGAAILAIFYLLELEGYGKMLLMGLISLPILTFIGYYWTHKAQKTIEYFNLKFTTHFAQYGYRLQEKQVQLLEELNKNLKKLNEKND